MIGAAQVRDGNRRIDLKKKRMLVILIVLTLCAIWFQSALHREASTSESRWFFDRIRSIMSFLVGPELATEILLRKMAHFAEFFMLGTESLLLCILIGRRDLRSLSAVFLLCNFCAFLDETIQIFSGRGSAVSDIWIDTFGSVSGILFVLFACAVADTLKEERENRRSGRDRDA